MLKVRIHNNLTGDQKKSFECAFRSWDGYDVFVHHHAHIAGTNTFHFDVIDEAEEFDLPLIDASRKNLLRVMKEVYPDARDWHKTIEGWIEKYETK